ncbi:MULTISPECIES: hypothetical protein [unclassified Actinotalea]|uniref:hypothetical protein n=1 Tax=unclassified Actinotalea TaxID=2638618 RepID=UPI0015F61A58|nr:MULTISPECIES: hypothetical protein [unclassified Actinotalea]
MLSGCGGAAAKPEPEPTSASEDVEWEDPFDHGEDGDRLHAIMADHDAVLDAWYEAEAAGDLAASQQGALAYADALRPMLGALRDETFTADYQKEHADTVLVALQDAIASAENAAAAPTQEEYDAAVLAGYDEIGARAHLAVLLHWV